MATQYGPGVNAYNIQLTPDVNAGRVQAGELTKESADKTSELLMVNHVRYHTLFDYVGFHNHTVHHLLTLYALGATGAEIQDMYDLNKPYQFLMPRRTLNFVLGLRDKVFFRQCIGKPDYYADFLRFFQDEIAERGVADVVNEYVFKGDELADDIFGRMHSGFLHPLIHLGCALEFQQPCLVAESLAAACVHDEWPQQYLLPTQEATRQNPATKPATLLEVINGLHSDPVIRSAVQLTDPLNKISDGLLRRVRDQLIPHLAQYQVQPEDEDLQRRMTEMMQTCAYMVGAAQSPGKVEALDFVMMHTVTLATFYPTFMAQDWISNHNKKRLLEWKAWSDAIMYAGCGCPTLYSERVLEYTAKRPQDGWLELFHRASVYRDDGHISKVVRSLYGLHSDKTAAASDYFLDMGVFAFRMAHMSLDSVERMSEPGKLKVPDKIRKTVAEEMGQDDEIVRVMVRWVRWCGVEGAWDDFPDLATQAQTGQDMESTE